MKVQSGRDTPVPTLRKRNAAFLPRPKGQGLPAAESVKMELWPTGWKKARLPVMLWALVSLGGPWKPPLTDDTSFDLAKMIADLRRILHSV
jgi:hypothetical protein